MGESTESADVLVIEDIRTFRFPATYARNIHDARRLLFSQPWDQVWFDHDLGLELGAQDTMSLVRELERLAFEGNKHPIRRVYVHSANPVGRANIAAALARWYEVRMVVANDYLAEGSARLEWVGQTGA